MLQANAIVHKSAWRVHCSLDKTSPQRSTTTSKKKRFEGEDTKLRVSSHRMRLMTDVGCSSCDAGKYSHISKFSGRSND